MSGSWDLAGIAVARCSRRDVAWLAAGWLPSGRLHGGVARQRGRRQRRRRRLAQARPRPFARSAPRLDDE